MRASIVMIAALCAAPIAGVPAPVVPASAPIASPTIADTGAIRDSIWADSVLATMSLRDKAAQMVWPIILGDYVAEHSDKWRRISSWVAEQHVGGIVMSVGAPMEIATKVNALQRASPLPLLIAADLENGAGFRARSYFVPNAIDLGGATQFSAQMALGATGDTSLAYQQGAITAQEGRALGIDIAFAPVLDVNNNPNNPVINVRSLGEDPKQVALLGSALIRGLQDHGMIATGKHFPGHGDVDVNSHLALPVVHATRARLDSTELVSFKAAIASGVGAIMSFHGVLPALDSSGVPATLSQPTLTGLLRGQLRFQGLIVSDAMDMEGVLAQFGSPEASKRAVAAGIDVLIFPPDVGQTIDAIVTGVTEGRYTEARVTASARRILRLKSHLGLVTRREVPLDSVRTIVGDDAHVAVARQIAERSMTLVKDPGGLVPIARTGRVWSVTYARRAELSAGASFDAEVRRAVPSLMTRFVASGLDAVLLRSVADSVQRGDLVITSVYPAALAAATTSLAAPALDQFISDIQQRGARIIVVSFANPYLLSELPASISYLIAWDGVPIAQQAAARAIIGTNAITGRLPISIPPAARRGDGIMRKAIGEASSH